MNIINKLVYNFAEHKICLFCNSKLKANEIKEILFLEFDPHYCNNCSIDYSNSYSGMLRIKYKTFIFSIDIGRSLDVWTSYDNRIAKKEIPNVIDKAELYNHFDKIIKEYIFQ